MMKVDELSKRIQCYSIRLSREEKIQSKFVQNHLNGHILQYPSANHKDRNQKPNVESQWFVSCAYALDR